MINPDRHIDVMGIVNLTDDSYYAASRYLDGSAPEKAVAAAGEMLEQGAGIIDFGACSSRPGSRPLSAEQEWRRLEPVVAAFLEKYNDVRFSIDTWHAQVISDVYELSAGIIGCGRTRDCMIVNDISAGEDDPAMLPLVGSLGLEYIAMHKRGTSENMQDLCEYHDVTTELREYFEAFARKAEDNGIRKWVLDPGFGFAKTLEHNYELLRSLDMLSGCGQSATLAGVSRKSMVYRYLGISPEDALAATQVLHLKALQMGADILRVHDVAEAVRTVSLYRVLR